MFSVAMPAVAKPTEAILAVGVDIIKLSASARLLGYAAPVLDMESMGKLISVRLGMASMGRLISVRLGMASMGKLISVRIGMKGTEVESRDGSSDKWPLALPGRQDVEWLRGLYGPKTSCW